jgi:hypothetical protein
MPETAITITVPTEPPVYAVALDAYDHAWQHKAGGWMCVERVVQGLLGPMNGPIPWTGLLLRGTVRVIWTPSEAKTWSICAKGSQTD